VGVFPLGTESSEGCQSVKRLHLERNQEREESRKGIKGTKSGQGSGVLIKKGYVKEGRD